jgi:hypothetical protein
MSLILTIPTSAVCFITSLFLLFYRLRLRKSLLFQNKPNKCRGCTHDCHSIHSCELRIQTAMCPKCEHYHMAKSDGDGHEHCYSKITVLQGNVIKEIECKCTKCYCFRCERCEIMCDCEQCLCVKCVGIDKRYLHLITYLFLESSGATLLLAVQIFNSTHTTSSNTENFTLTTITIISLLISRLFLITMYIYDKEKSFVQFIKK